MKTIGKRLTELREKAELSQSQLGKLIMMPKSTIAGYEQDYRMPPIEQLKKFASFYGVSESFLINGTDNLYDKMDHETNELIELIRRSKNILTPEKKLELSRYIKFLLND